MPVFAVFARSRSFAEVRSIVRALQPGDFDCLYSFWITAILANAIDLTYLRAMLQP